MVFYSENKQDELKTCEKMSKIYELIIEHTKNKTVEEFCLKKQKN